MRRGERDRQQQPQSPLRGSARFSVEQKSPSELNLRSLIHPSVVEGSSHTRTNAMHQHTLNIPPYSLSLSLSLALFLSYPFPLAH